MTDSKNDERVRQAVAEVATSPVANSSKTIQTVVAQRYGTNLTLGEVLAHISEEVSNLTDPNSEQAKELVAAQALVLDQVFHHCVERGMRSGDARVIRTMIDTGLRAQRSSLKSLEVLSRLNALPRADKGLPDAGQTPYPGQRTQPSRSEQPANGHDEEAQEDTGQTPVRASAPRKRRDVEPVGRRIKKITHLRAVAGGRN